MTVRVMLDLYYWLFEYFTTIYLLFARKGTCIVKHIYNWNLSTGLLIDNDYLFVVELNLFRSYIKNSIV